MNLLLFGLTVFAVFLFAVLVMAVIIVCRYHDDTATYKLYAVRDRLIDAAVFRGVPREDLWLESLYDNVNSLLVHSHFLAGPRRWRVAQAIGTYLAANPHKGKKLRQLPSYEPPLPIQEILPELKPALQHLLENHQGLQIQFSAERREARRLQREKAKQLLEMLKSADGPKSNGHIMTPA